jgi:hypothetical protein
VNALSCRFAYQWSVVVSRSIPSQYSTILINSFRDNHAGSSGDGGGGRAAETKSLFLSTKVARFLKNSGWICCANLFLIILREKGQRGKERMCPNRRIRTLRHLPVMSLTPQSKLRRAEKELKKDHFHISSLLRQIHREH